MVKETVYGLKLVDMTVETIKILRIHFSYKSEAQRRDNFSVRNCHC